MENDWSVTESGHGTSLTARNAVNTKIFIRVLKHAKVCFPEFSDLVSLSQLKSL